MRKLAQARCHGLRRSTVVIVAPDTSTGISSIGAERRVDPADAEQFPRPRAVEQDPQIGDIAVGPDLLALDDDRADQPVERRIAQVGRFGRSGACAALAHSALNPFALRDPPAGIARGIGILAADIDVDAGDFQRAAAVDRQNSAIARFELRIATFRRRRARRWR